MPKHRYLSYMHESLSDADWVGNIDRYNAKMRANSYIPLLLMVLMTTACKQAAKSDNDHLTPTHSTGSVKTTEPVQVDTRIVGWRQGESYRYHIKMSSKIALGEQATLYDFELTGIAELSVMAAGPETASFHVEFQSGSFLSRIPGTQAQFDKVGNELKRPYFFDMRGGLVTAASLPQDLHPMAAAVFRTFSASLQFARVQNPERGYVATEYDTTGQYVAEYTPLGDKSSWKKRKQRYLGILLAKNQPREGKEVVPEVVTSEIKIRLADDGRPVAVGIQDEIVLRNAQSPLQSRTEISVTAEPAAVAARPGHDWSKLREGTVALSADAPFESEMDRADLDVAKINGMTFEKVVTGLEQSAERSKQEKADAGNDGTAKQAALKKQAEEESKLFVALGAILRHQPEAVGRAVKKIQGKSPVSDILIDGLGSADSPGAQRALTQLVENVGNDDRLRTRALISLSRTEHPTAESVIVMVKLANHEMLGAQAHYGIGSYCRLFKDSGRTDAASKLGEFLVQRLAAVERSEAKLTVVLRAIGISGYSPALPKVKPYLVDQREQLRVDALRALSAMESSEVDPILDKSLSGDTSKVVRMAAIEAMFVRTPGDILVNSLRSASTTDDPHVRYRAVDLMIRWLPRRSDLRQSIALVAQNDEEQKIRDLAKAAL